LDPEKEILEGNVLTDIQTLPTIVNISSTSVNLSRVLAKQGYFKSIVFQQNHCSSVPDYLAAELGRASASLDYAAGSDVVGCSIATTSF